MQKKYWIFWSLYIISLSSFAQTIAGGRGHSLFICNDGGVKACGENSRGELGVGTISFTERTPLQTNSLTSVRALAAGTNYSLALKNDGTVWAWGKNDWGQLGDGTTVDKNSPIQILGLNNITAIASGKFQHSLAVKSDGTVWAWGQNITGILGNGNSINTLLPVKVSVLTDIVSVAAGSYHSLALKKDGTVWAWGSNNFGQLGTGDSLSINNIPTKLPSLTGIVAISAGLDFGLALRGDGTVWCWGNNTNGQLGDNTNGSKNTPVKVLGLTNIISIAAGELGHCLALKDDGTVWAWGNNSIGQLGDGTQVNRNAPVQVTGLTDVSGIAAGHAYSIAHKNDGTVWAWGDNTSGCLGDGTGIFRKLPVRVNLICSISNPLNVLTFNTKTCYEQCTGSASVFVSGGTRPYTYLWSSSETSSAVTGLCPGIYNGTIMDAVGAEYEFEAEVSEINCETECDLDNNIFIPNAFSPNGDGQNDVLTIYFHDLTCINKYELRIYDRWGKLISSGDTWDGKYKGNEACMGVYFYVLKVLAANNETKVYNGNISLIR